MTKEISYADHLKDMAEFEPYMEFLEDQTEMETAVKYLMEFPNTDYLSEEFQQMYYREVRAQLEWFKENTTIEEIPAKEITVKTKPRKELKYDNE